MAYNAYHFWNTALRDGILCTLLLTDEDNSTEKAHLCFSTLIHFFPLWPEEKSKFLFYLIFIIFIFIIIILLLLYLIFLLYV